MKSLKIIFVFVFIAMMITYSCTKDVVKNSVNESISAPEPQVFEKQLVIYDASGNNSITLRVSSDDETLLAGYVAENYELLINSVIPEESSVDALKYEEEDDEDLFEIQGIELIKPVIHIDVIAINFKDKVNNYSLVSLGSSVIDEDEAEMKAGLCRWFPRDYQYYDVDAWGATKVKMTFNRTKKTCNNIKYYVCKYNTTDAYAYHHLKHPGDEATTNVQEGQPGITLLYKHYKNQTPTYTFYY